jgi:pimeloyl-ACP methyl ester carboxylesterase
MVAETVEAHTLKDCGHFIPEEAPGAVVKHILGMTARTMRGNKK